MMALALLTPQLDAQTSFSKLFADIGTQKDVRHSDLHCSLPALRRLLRSLPSMSRPSVLTCGLRHSRVRLASRHTLPSSCLAPPNSSDVMSLGTAVPCWLDPIARGYMAV